MTGLEFVCTRLLRGLLFCAYTNPKSKTAQFEYLETGINLLEIDALLQGSRLLPPAASRLAEYDRNAWSVCHEGDRRRFRGWGWNHSDPLPTLSWQIEPSRQVIINLDEAFRQACEFNPWEQLVAQAHA